MQLIKILPKTLPYGNINNYNLNKQFRDGFIEAHITTGSWTKLGLITPHIKQEVYNSNYFPIVDCREAIYSKILNKTIKL